MTTSRHSECRPDLEVVTVRPTEAVQTLQRLPYFIGVSGQTSGAKALSMNMVVIPAGGAPSRIITAATRPRSTSSKAASRRATARG